MHGIIFSELRRFVEVRLGSERWFALLEAAGLGNRTYFSFREYPDEDILAILTSASAATGLEIPAILQDFGGFIAPTLIYMYPELIEPSWKTLDLVEHTESVIHKVVRKQNPGASPPRLRVTRLGPSRIRLDYSSERKLCPLIYGIVEGIAAHYGEQVAIEEPACMLRGAQQCEIVMTSG